MSAIAYWRDRLHEKFPLYNLEYVETDFVRINEGEFPKVWPMAISKQVLYNDYATWFDKVFLLPYKEVPYYVDNPGALPKADDQHTFFTTMGPFLYIIGQSQQDRTYTVMHVTESGLQLITQQKRHNFIRLCPIEAHAAVFEARTGMKVSSPRVRFDPRSDALIRKVIEAVKIKNDRVSAMIYKHQKVIDT